MVTVKYHIRGGRTT